MIASIQEFCAQLKRVTAVAWEVLGLRTLLVSGIFFVVSWILPFIEVSLLSSLSRGEITSRGLIVFTLVSVAILAMRGFGFNLGIWQTRKISRFYFSRIMSRGFAGDVAIPKSLCIFF